MKIHAKIDAILGAFPTFALSFASPVQTRPGSLHFGRKLLASACEVLM